jgi:hypothetical protein
MKQGGSKSADIQYRRLPGRGLRREGFVAVARTWGTLWLGRDHVLSVDTHLFSEDYKRFYFRDIQAIVIGKTRRGMVLNIVFSLFTASWLLIAINQSEPIGVTLWLIVTGVFAVMLGINAWRGPTCTCYLVTAVHKEILPSLNRIKEAEKVSQILRKHIENAQML